jgi:hypothetical protein
MTFLGCPLITINTTPLKSHGELQSPTVINIGKPCLEQKTFLICDEALETTLT